MKNLMPIILLGFSLGFSNADEILGTYLNSRFKIIYEPKSWTKEDSNRVKSALNKIGSLAENERMKIYTLLYIYFDNDGNFASRFTEIITKNKDISLWKKYIQSKEYAVKLEYGDTNYDNLLCKLSMIELHNGYSRSLRSKTPECK